MKIQKTKQGIAFKQAAVDLRNLKQVQSMKAGRSENVINNRIGMLNARSIPNKEELILEYIKDLKLDITVVTETWLQDRGRCYLN